MNTTRGPLPVALAALLITWGCAKTDSAPPANPVHSWLNGTWRGSGGRWEQTFWLKVVNGNEVRGKMQSCNSAGRCASGPLHGSIDGDTVTATVQKRWESSVGARGRTFHYTLVKSGDQLINQGIFLKKQSS